MRLSTMWKVDRATTDGGRNPIADELAGYWEHEPGSVRFFRASANFVYTIVAGDRHFLRFAETSERSRPAIEAELELLTSLARNGLAVAAPVPSRRGNVVETLNIDTGTYNASVFPALPGTELELGRLELSQIRCWGAALGRLHAEFHRLRDLPHSARPSWRDRLRSVAPYLGVGAVSRERDRVTSTLDELPVTSDNYGIVHGDFELDNLVWNGEVTGMLDFDECGDDWFAADIAYALRDLFPRGFDPAEDRFDAFLTGYRRHFELDASLSAVPTFLRLAALLEYGKIARALDLPVSGEHPEWLQNLARKLQRRMDAYRASLAAA